MGWFTSLFTASAAEPIGAIGNVLDELFTSDEEELNLEIIKQRLSQQPALAQVELNKVQAAHRSTFVAGARPFLMWVCGVGLAMAFIVNPMIEYLNASQDLINVPLDQMMELVIAMLGLSTLRTVEKMNGKTK